jgi:hypothetical protein
LPQETNLTKLFADLLALGKPVTYESMKKRMAKESWLSAPFDPAAYTREIETPLLSQGWTKKGNKLMPPAATTGKLDTGKAKPLRKVDPKRLRMLRDRAIEIALERFIDGDATSGELAAALRGLPLDPPAPPPIDAGKQPSPDELKLCAEAYLDTLTNQEEE